MKVEKIFEILALMERLRDILRQTAPVHRFSPEEKNQIQQSIQKAKEILDELEGSL
ncbi:MAG: hypothetical protein V2A53_02370 [bacterium]